MLSETIGGVPTWIAAAAGGAVLLLVIIVAILSGKKKPLPTRMTRGSRSSEPTTRAPDPSVGALLKMDFSERAAAGLRTLHSPTGPGHGQYIEGQLVLMGGENTRMREETPVEGGQAFRFNYRVRVLNDGTNGSPQNYFVGPLTIDAAGNIIGWWSERSPISAAQGPVDGVLDFIAPEGAKSMTLGVASSFHADRPPSDAVFAFASAWVKRID